MASNQELNKADYDTVRHSYTSALGCARRAGDAKLEVLLLRFLVFNAILRILSHTTHVVC